MRPDRSWVKWLHPDNAFVWLAYLPLFFIPWAFTAPKPEQMLGAAIGLAAFLVLYVVGELQTDIRARTGFAIAVLLLSFALAFTHGNWTVISVYAAAMIAHVRPAGRGGLAIALFCAATAAWGFYVGMPALYIVMGVFFMAMTGAATLSRLALTDKHAALLRAQSEVRELAATAERERIGRDLHDLLGRTLTLVSMKADLAARLVARDPAQAEAEMREVAAAARDALQEVRTAVSGMTGASLARELAVSRAALDAARIACDVDGEPEPVERGAGAVLAMTLREAVTNVIRHSGARRCRITFVRRNGALELSVVDDGAGEATRESGGLAGVRARLAAAGGHLRVSGDSNGTHLVAAVPETAAS